jgi:hypothetical protein
MKKYFTMVLFCLLLTSPLLAMGRDGSKNHQPGQGPGDNHRGTTQHPGGSGTPEPATLLLLLAGGGAAFITKKIIKK